MSTNFTTLALNTFIVCRQSFFILLANPFTGTPQKSLIFTWDTKSVENFESSVSTNFTTLAFLDLLAVLSGTISVIALNYAIPDNAKKGREL